jgi:hypothetical protein
MEVRDREVEGLRIGVGCVTVAIGLRVEAGEDGAFAVEVVAPRRHPPTWRNLTVLALNCVTRAADAR